jgi:hypothetical protein
LDNNDNSELVTLDMEEVLQESSPNDFDEFKLVDDVFNTQIEINRSYLELAKVHLQSSILILSIRTDHSS